MNFYLYMFQQSRKNASLFIEMCKTKNSLFLIEI